jgi:hypothetical protein
VTAVRTQVNEAIVAMLAGLAGGGLVRTVRSYEGELGHEDVEDVLRTLSGIAPAILVAVEQAAFRGVDVRRRTYRRDLLIVLYMVSVSQKTPEARGDELAQIEDAVLAILLGAKPLLVGIPCGVLVPVSGDVMAHDPTICIWRQLWQIAVESELAELPAPNVVEVDGSLNAPSDGDHAADPLLQVSDLVT